MTHLMVSSEARTIEILDGFAREGADAAQRRWILQIAETASSSSVRNAAAMAMAALRIEGATQILADLIAREDTRDDRGTLLYALEELGEKVSLPLLVAVLLDGSYETREQALDLLGKEQVAFTAEQMEAAITALSALAASDDDYVSVVGRTAVRWLKALKRKRT